MARFGRDEERWAEEQRGRGYRGEREDWRPEEERYLGRRGEWRGPERWRHRGRSTAEEQREVMEGGDLGWPGGVQGSEGGAGYGRGFFGTAYGLYAGRPEHEPYARDRWAGGAREAFRGRGRGPKGYRRSDERILDEIVERLVWSGIDAADVEIKVEGGKVTLTGAVADRHDKRLLEDTCEDVMGVDEVENHVRVSRRHFEGERGADVH